MKWRPVVIALVVTVPIIAIFLRGMQVDPTYVPPALPGQVAPDFALETMPPAAGVDDGAASVVRLSDHRGRVVVLNFWASWCLPCRYEHPEIIAAAQAYRGRAVDFLGVLYKDTPDGARRWLEEMGGAIYPTLLDPGARTAIDYGLTGVPETVVIDPAGTVVFKRNGPVTLAVLTAQIDPLLAGLEASP